MQSQVFQMFPTPLYVNTYEGDLTEVVEYFNSQEMNPAMGGGYGEISKNSYVIDHPVCADLNKFFMSCFKDFLATEIYSADAQNVAVSSESELYTWGGNST